MSIFMIQIVFIWIVLWEAIYSINDGKYSLSSVMNMNVSTSVWICCREDGIKKRRKRGIFNSNICIFIWSLIQTEATGSLFPYSFSLGQFHPYWRKMLNKKFNVTLTLKSLLMMLKYHSRLFWHLCFNLNFSSYINTIMIEIIEQWMYYPRCYEMFKREFSLT